MAFKSVNPSYTKTKISQEAYLQQRERQAKALQYCALPPQPPQPGQEPKPKKARKQKAITIPATATATAAGAAASGSSSTPTKSPSRSSGGNAPPEEVFRGTPEEDLGGVAGLTAWPTGWVKILMERKSGKGKGTRDRYWFTPGGKKLRSMSDVKKFLTAMTLPEIGGDEGKAWKIYKSIQL